MLLICSCSKTELPQLSDEMECASWIAQTPPCNGSTEYCDRRYDELSYPTTHNAMSNAADEWFGPNQNKNMKTQLLDGIRAFMIDTHYDSESEEPVPSLCHGGCILGSIPLVEALGIFEAFLRCNPEEVLTLIVEAYVSVEDTKQAFDEAGLTPYLYAHDKTQAWPTLQKLIDENTRLIVLSDEGEASGWYMNVWDHAFETPFSASEPKQLTCAKNRGEDGNSLFILNHFLTTLTGSEILAERVNYNPYFLERAQKCEQEFMHIPNFVVVDFYSVGDVFEVTKSLNSQN